MKFIVQAPIQKVSNEGAGGVVTEKKILKIKVSEDGNKVEDGIYIKADTELTVIITDPAKFAKYTVGQAVEVALS